MSLVRKVGKKSKKNQLSAVPAPRESTVNCQLSAVRQKGFTLIELMVSLLLIFIMTALVFPQFRNYSRFYEVKKEAELIRSMLIQAQDLSFGPRVGGCQQSTFTYAGSSYQLSGCIAPPAVDPEATPRSQNPRVIVNDRRTFNVDFLVPAILPGQRQINAAGTDGAGSPCSSANIIVRDSSDATITKTIRIQCNSGIITVI